jgi:hypothetical protein
MTQTVREPLYRRHRFPAEVIAPAVWLYLRFPFSLRMVEDLLAARGIIVSHQTVRLWAEKFGRHLANEIRRRSAGKLGDKWYLDEVVISIGGKKHWLWRAADQEGFVLDVLAQSRRNIKAAKRLMQKLLKGQGQAPEQPRICRRILCLIHSAIASFLELFNPSALRPCHYAWWRCCSIPMPVGWIYAGIAPWLRGGECRDWPLP